MMHRKNWSHFVEPWGRYHDLLIDAIEINENESDSGGHGVNFHASAATAGWGP